MRKLGEFPRRGGKTLRFVRRTAPGAFVHTATQAWGIYPQIRHSSGADAGGAGY